MIILLLIKNAEQRFTTMAFMLSDLAAGFERLNAGAKGIAYHHVLRVMPKHNPAAARAAEWQQLSRRTLAGIDV